jgi:hypothetical protein
LQPWLTDWPFVIRVESEIEKPMRPSGDDFLSLLSDLNLSSLENDSNPAFGLNADLCLAYVNPAWFRFAKENRGEPSIFERFASGTPIVDEIHGPLKQYFLDKFEAALRTGVSWRQTYECSSAETFRLYHQTIYPLRDGRGLIFVNSLAVVEPMAAQARRARAPERRQYESPDRTIVQCSNCRRVQRVRQPSSWDWVPAWVARMPDGVSQGLCDACRDCYYASDPPQARSHAASCS